MRSLLYHQYEYSIANSWEYIKTFSAAGQISAFSTIHDVSTSICFSSFANYCWTHCLISTNNIFIAWKKYLMIFSQKLDACIKMFGQFFADIIFIFSSIIDPAPLALEESAYHMSCEYFDISYTYRLHIIDEHEQVLYTRERENMVTNSPYPASYLQSTLKCFNPFS